MSPLMTRATFLSKTRVIRSPRQEWDSTSLHSEDVCGNHTHQRALRQRPCYRDNRWVETLPTPNRNRVHRHPRQ